MNLRFKALIGSLLASTLCLTACSDTRILEDLGFLHTIGFEFAEGKGPLENNNLLVTFRVMKAEADGKKGSETLTIIATSGIEAKTYVSRQTNNLLVSGQFRSVLFSSEYARTGIWNDVDTLIRDPTIGPRVRLAVVEGSVHDFLKSDFAEHPDVGQYIDLLLEKEEQVNIVAESNLHIFLRDILDDGVDPVIPILKLGDNEIIVDGIAIFDDDRFVQKIIPKRAMYFFFMNKNFTAGELSVKLPRPDRERKDLILLSRVNNKRKIVIDTSDQNQIKAHISMKIKASLSEYVGENDISEKKYLEVLETELAAYIKNETEKMVQELQQVKADPIGIGQYVRNKLSAKQWEELDWQQIYPNIKVSTSVDVTIKNIGSIKAGKRFKKQLPKDN